MARGRGRGRGRGAASVTPTSTRVTRTRSSASADEIVTPKEEILNNVTDEKANVSVNDVEMRDVQPKRRGRKRKSELLLEERYLPASDPTKRGIIAQGGSLRRRDTLKSTARYSPPPAATRSKTGRGSITIPNTPKIVIDADSDNSTGPSLTTKSTDTSTPVNRRKSLGIQRIANSTVTVEENIDDVKPVEKTIEIELPDGTISKITGPFRTEELEEEIIDKESEKDLDYKPATRSTRKKSDPTPVENNTTPTIVNNNDGGSTESPIKSPKMQNITTVKIINQSPSTISTVAKTTTNSVTVTNQMNKATAVIAQNSKSLPAILKPLPTTTINTAVLKNTPTNRRLQPLTKYLDALPELADCISSDGIEDSEMVKMPDKLMLIHSELPLDLATSIDNEDNDYLFRQIISPVQTTRFVCLLCKGIDVNFGTKEEREILLHYQSLHELEVDVGHAKFSEDVVFICLPKMVLSQLNSSSALHLNSSCQYCQMKLNDIEEMKKHYRETHQKEVILMEQENIMNMHHNFYCCKCRHPSETFEEHHKHMKEKHQMKTYRCKSCVLVTQEENRLRTHFKAKHMLHSSGQNYQCYYCHGLLIGVERLLKHIQQSHMVQTGNEFSCIACQQVCGRGKELLNHAQNCALAGVKPEQIDNKCVPIVVDTSPLVDEQVDCYFCNVRLENDEIYKLHLHHEHMKWVSDATKQAVEDAQMLTINDVITDENLKKAKIETYVGHWCRMCDQMVKVYQLFYLHMINYHKLEKEFQCIITSCKAQFKEFEDFKKHIEETGHSQKTVISHPDEVFVCTYCDIYYPTEEELINHLITDQHINKFTASGHFHRTEPRNFKCKACHTFFGMKESYVHHLETESHKYRCTYCNITTATPSSRRAHVQNTHPEKLHLCEDCSVPTQDILAHFVSHGFTFECKKCVKKFYNRERLNAHMEVHQDPIECTWDNCGRMIATRSMLVTHYRGHKSEHKCQVCGQAFWNFSMLTSHLRSHQSLPRSNQNVKNSRPLSTYSNFSNRGGISNRGRGTANLIKCGHCGSYFRSTRELNLHPCTKGRGATVNNVGSNKLFDMASKTSNVSKAGKQMNQVRRKASPKKQTVIEQPIMEMPLSGQTEVQAGDDETQLIMILNQVTGELMEITAPKGMEVKDVIDSLNFQQMEDGSTVTVASNDAAQIETEETMVQPEQIETSEQEETAAAIEIIEQEATEVEPQTIPMVTEEQTYVEEQQPVEEAEIVDPNSMIIEQPGNIKEEDDGGQQIQFISDQGGDQTIVLPANCFNEDGSLTLDADTLSRLNLVVDDSGNLTHDPNTTFVIADAPAQE